MKLTLFLLSALVSLPLLSAEISRQEADKAFNEAFAAAAKTIRWQTNKSEAAILEAIEKHPFKDTESSRLVRLADVLVSSAGQPARALPYYKKVWDRADSVSAKAAAAVSMAQVNASLQNYPEAVKWVETFFSLKEPDAKKEKQFRTGRFWTFQNRICLHFGRVLSPYIGFPKEFDKMFEMAGRLAETPAEKYIVARCRAQLINASGDKEDARKAYLELRKIEGLTPVEQVNAWLGPWADWTVLRSADEKKLDEFMKEAIPHFKNDPAAISYLYERWLFRASYTGFGSSFAPEKILAIAEAALQNNPGANEWNAAKCKFMALVRMKQYKQALSFIQPYLDRTAKPSDNTAKRMTLIGIMTASDRWNKPPREEALSAALTLCGGKNAPEDLMAEQIKILCMLDRPEEAAQLIPVDSVSGRLLVPVAAWYMENGQVIKAKNLLSRVDAAQKSLPGLYFKIKAQCLYAAGDVHGALESLKLYSTRGNPDWRERRLLPGNIKYLETKLQKAEAAGK